MAKIVIEGLPAAGKTTLVTEMMFKGYNTVTELGGIIKIDKMPGDGKNLEEVLKIDDWFIEKESLRDKNYLSEKRIMDRNFFTHLTYSYAYSRLTKIPSFRKTINKYKSAVENKILSIPETLIFLDIEPLNSIKRQVQIKRRLPLFWRDEIFLLDLRHAYFSLIESLQEVDTLILNQGNSLEKNYQIVENMVCNLSDFEEKERKLNFNKYMSLLSK